MTELLFNIFINLGMITCIIFMLSMIICIVKIMYTWIDDWREENESNIDNR